MRRLAWMLFGVMVGAAGMWGSMNYHLLRTHDGMACVAKYRPELANTYYDVREWGVTEWAEHPELVMTLQQQERTEIIGDAKVLGTSLKEMTRFVK